MAEAQEAQLSHNTPTTLVHDPIAQPAPKTTRCALLALPLEILERILNLATQDHYNIDTLSKTCSTFYHRYRHDIVVSTFEQNHLLHTVFCLRDTKPGEFGWRPFTILDAEYGEDKEEDAVQLIVVEHPLDLFKPTTPTWDYLVLQVTTAGVFLNPNDMGYWLESGDSFAEGWDSTIRGRLIKATPKLVHERYPCPECKGSRRVLYGSKELSRRWPCIDEHPRPYMAKCPRCTIYAQSAYDSHEAYMRASSRRRD